MSAGHGRARRWPLSVRLAAVLAVTVAVVLLAAGGIVNQVVTGSLAATVSAGEQSRFALAVAILEDHLGRAGPDARIGVHQALADVAGAVGGNVILLDSDGALVDHAGELVADGTPDAFRQSLSNGGTFEIRVPSRRAAFLSTFNMALLLTGLISLVLLVIAAVVAADRLTRPIRLVALAAHRVGHGDLTARAISGPDRESDALARAFNEMAARLERSEELRRRAASDIAHDLATPAMVVESQLQAMHDGILPADAAQLDKARAAAAGLSAIVVQLGELASAEAAPLQRQVSQIDVRDAVRTGLAAFEGLIRDRHLALDVQLGSEPAVTDADPSQLARAIRNVVTNAMQHSPAGGTVAVHIDRKPGFVEIRVADQGAGISEGDVAHVFERFYRAERSRGGERTGSGIGLTIARDLVTANAGTIDVEQTGPEGTTVLIRLPAAAAGPIAAFR